MLQEEPFYVQKKGKYYFMWSKGDHRATCIDKMEFDKNGLIKPVKITFEGGVRVNRLR